VRNAGYVLWDPAAKRVLRSRHVLFDEHVFYGDPSPSPLASLLPGLSATDEPLSVPVPLPPRTVGALGG
jgi:hypothetical protein